MKINNKQQLRSESLGLLAWRKLRRHPAGMIGIVLIGILVFVSIFAPMLAPFDPKLQILEYSVKSSMFQGNVLYTKNPANPSQPSVVAIESFTQSGDSVHYIDLSGRNNSVHLSKLWGKNQSEWYDKPIYYLGTDNFGRDVLSRLIYGARISLMVGVVSQVIALIIGIFLGALAGYFRGWVDNVVLWFINVVWSFPTILLAILFSSVLKSTHDVFGFELNAFWQTFIAIGISSWVDIARIVRGQFFSLREMEYVEATRALGFGSFRTIFRHILPNAFGPIIVLATAGIATSIIAEAGLSFLGLGIQKPEPSWGILIFDGYGYIAAGTNWGLTLYPSIAMAAAVYGFNLLGDGLRDALDPKSIQR